MSALNPIDVDDSEYELVQDGGQDQLSIEDEENDKLPDAIPIIDDDDELSATRKSIRNTSIHLPDVKENSVRLFNDTVILPGDTVELKDASAFDKKRQSGDFLKVHFIIHNLETDEYRLRGHRLRRCKYHGPIFDWKLNELVMLLHTTEGDSRDHWTQGFEDHPIEDIVRKRNCIVTNKPYGVLNFSTQMYPSFFPNLSEEEKKDWVFYHGKLFCRAVHVIELNANGKNYDGIIRRISAREADDQLSSSSAAQTGPGATRKTSIAIEDPDNGMPTPRRRVPVAVSAKKYTFGDAFCGAGGTSQGAKQAGLVVKWGLDINHLALQAYLLNHDHAEPFLMDVRDFPPHHTSQKDIKVDILHLSPTCKYWSMAHTVQGRNDQNNYETLYTVQRVLQKVKATVVTLEMAPGLLQKKQHANEFRQLLNQFWCENYNLRYGVRDLSTYGVPQQRRRLLIIAAKRGHPLPPFPRATHGPEGSGLERFTTVYDALRPLRILGPNPPDDRYHLPRNRFNKPEVRYDPEVTLLKGCITTNGGDNFHWNGRRRFTPRELSLFQTFPYGYHFHGADGDAIEQIGNAVPPTAFEKEFRTIAATLEAFAHGFIEANDEIEDLYDHLAKNPKVVLPEPAPRKIGQNFDRPAPDSGFRYLVRQAGNGSGGGTPTKRAPLFKSVGLIEPRPKKMSNGSYQARTPKEKASKNDAWKAQLLEASDEVIHISDDEDN